MAFRLARPAHLIDINAVAGLDGLAVGDEMLGIGARTRHASFHRPVQDGPLGAMLAAVVRHIAHYPTRLRGTFCGSLAHADPAAEWCLVAATLGADLIAISARGERRLAARDFFEGAMATALAPDELLAETRLPIQPDGTRFGFKEFSRRAGDYALAMALVVLRIEDGMIAAPRIGLGAVEARPRRIEAAEAALSGRRPGEAVFREAAATAAAAIEPIEDAQTNAQYRRELAGAMVYRALTRACMPDWRSRA
jgi:carbon-monoxide dehydrogenase medium subunit